MAARQAPLEDGMEQDGTRVRTYADGRVVRVRPDGETTVRRPDGVTITRRADGSHLIERPGASAQERPAPTPHAERPLNVGSGSGEQVGRLMSNFAHTPFTLDGRAYASVEGFYQGLKFAEEEQRAVVAALHGREAKAAARGVSLTTTVYEGEVIELGSAAHHELIKRAIRAKLDQHPELAAAFMATRPRPIVHNLGRRARRPTAFAAEVFCRILTELREEMG